jgi:hypothetical protein
VLSLNEVRRRTALFATQWKDKTGERQFAQGFWRALMRAYGIEDQEQRGVLFEKQVEKGSGPDKGKVGYIDVFWPGLFLAEHKSAGELSGALGSTRTTKVEQQAEAYFTSPTLASAERPRYVLLSDFSTLNVTDLDKPRGDPTRTLSIRTEELPKYVEAFWFLTGRDDAEIVIQQEQAAASVKAARLMGSLFAALTHDADSGKQDDEAETDEATYDASILLTRLLFLMFGDDSGLWETGLFKRFVLERTSPDGTDVGPQLERLFQVLDTPRDKRSNRLDELTDRFPYVNGGVFERGISMIHDFDQPMREALVRACEFDWSRISPAVFGSLFQTVHSKDQRDAAGEHYTSEANILKTIGPLFLDEYRSRLNAANTKPTLETLHAELRHLRYVDPACGCGNFLIVAYREMRALELDLLDKLRTMQERGRDRQFVLDATHQLNVTLDQFTGLEIAWWPAKIAETAMFLVDHQANMAMAKRLGQSPDRLPIDIEARIVHANALAIEWTDVLPGPGDTVYIFGNPPFLGHEARSSEQLAELQSVWGDSKALARMDYVTGWYAKAIKYFGDRRLGEFAFVSTNSITQGDQVPRLFRPLVEAGWRIKFAHRTFAWDSETASKDRAVVHCVVLGFSRTMGDQRVRVFTYASSRAVAVESQEARLNGYLVNGPDVWLESRTHPLSVDLPSVAFGSMPRDGGNLLVDSPEDREVVLADPVAAKYLHRFVGARELIHGEDRWCLWLVDLDPRDLAESPVLKERVDATRAFRVASKAASTRDYPYPHLFVQLAQPQVAYLCIPRHFSAERRYATVSRLAADVIAGDSNFTCADPDGFAFGAIESSMFLTWQRTVGGRIKSDLRFSKDIVWNNFPLPAVDAEVRHQIIAAGKKVETARDLHPDWSLADQYNPLAMTPELVKAHGELDRVVDKAFGAGRARMDEQARQALLFERYLDLVGS